MGERHGRGLQLSLVNRSQKNSSYLAARPLYSDARTRYTSQHSLLLSGTVSASTGSDVSHLRLHSNCETLANHPTKQVLGQAFGVYFPSHASAHSIRLVGTICLKLYTIKWFMPLHNFHYTKTVERSSYGLTPCTPTLSLQSFRHSVCSNVYNYNYW
jgi:hypothetical protein